MATIEPNAAPQGERKPWLLGFLCIVLLAIPAEIVPVGPLKSYGSPAKILALIAFLLVVGSLFPKSAKTHFLRPGSIFLLAYLFLFLMSYGVGLSLVSTEYTSDNRTRAVVALVANIGAGLYVMSRAETIKQRDFILGCIAVGLVFNCCVGVLQNLTDVDLRNLLQPPGFVKNLNREGTDVGIAERFGAKRAIGTSGHAIEFSVLAAISVPVALYFASFATSRAVRVMSIPAVLVGFTAVVAGVSRSGVVALGIALIVLAWSYTVQRLTLGLLVVIGISWMQVIINPNSLSALWSTITNSAEDLSIQARLADYATVSQTFREYPLFGLGLGGNPPVEYGFLDNQWLQALVQGGLAGLTAMAALAIGIMFGATASLRQSQTAKERAQIYTITAMLFGILASSFTFDSFAVSYQQVALIFFILFAVCWSPVKVRLKGKLTI